jgi:hypothetical protein
VVDQLSGLNVGESEQITSLRAPRVIATLEVLPVHEFGIKDNGHVCLEPLQQQRATNSPPGERAPNHPRLFADLDGSLIGRWSSFNGTELEHLVAAAQHRRAMRAHPRVPADGGKEVPHACVGPNGR